MTEVLHMLHPLDTQVGELGSTVRLGDKWLSRVTHDPNLILCVCSDRCESPQTCSDPLSESCGVCTRSGKATVVSSGYGAFQDVPAKLLEHEHELRSRQYSGLRDSMTKAYGSSFNEGSEVTVIVYERLV